MACFRRAQQRVIQNLLKTGKRCGKISQAHYRVLVLMLALVAALAGSERTGWSKQLVSQQGFHGYSGAFRLLPDGRNIRTFELRKINDGRSKIVKPAADRI